MLQTKCQLMVAIFNVMVLIAIILCTVSVNPSQVLSQRDYEELPSQRLQGGSITKRLQGGSTIAEYTKI